MLTLSGVTKRFPGVLALDGVSFEKRGGEVHAVCGENGAGESTLMKVLSGLHQPDEGRIVFKGEPRHFATPLQAQSAGIAMIHQELNLVPHLSVAENIYLAREPRAGWFVDRAPARRCESPPGPARCGHLAGHQSRPALGRATADGRNREGAVARRRVAGTLAPAIAHAADKPLTIGFAQTGAESEWRTANTDSVKAAAQAAGVTLKFSDAQQKQENQIKAIRSFIAQKVDVIILAPLVTTGWDTVLLEAKAAKIPVLLESRSVEVKGGEAARVPASAPTSPKKGGAPASG